MTGIEDIKKDKERMLALREEDNTLAWKIESAHVESKHSGALFDHDYRDTWTIVHPKSGESFEAHSHWFNRFGTDEQKEEMDKRRRDIELSICADDRQRRKEIDKGIEKIYDNYSQLFHGLEYGYSEGRRCDGENDICDLIQVVINTMEFVFKGIDAGMEDIGNAINILEKDVKRSG